MNRKESKAKWTGAMSFCCQEYTRNSDSVTDSVATRDKQVIFNIAWYASKTSLIHIFINHLNWFKVRESLIDEDVRKSNNNKKQNN